MKLLSCITSLSEIIPIKKAGADEVYFAYEKVYNYGNSKSLKNLSEVKKAVDISHKVGMKAFLAANDIMFDTQNHKAIKEIKSVVSMGIDGIIVSSVGLLLKLKNLNIKVPIHLSSLNPVFNVETARIFSNFNISRIILPNQISAYESKDILNFCRENRIETEVFYFRYFGCPYINGYCYLHGDRYFELTSEEACLCKIGGRRDNVDVKIFNRGNSDSRVAKIRKRVRERFSKGGPPRIMTAAEFFDFYRLGATHVKYGTRTDDTRTKIVNVYNIKKAIDYMAKVSSMCDYEEAKEKFVKYAIGNSGVLK